MEASNLRTQLNEVIFGTDTRAGRLFDIVLIWLILASVLAVILASVDTIGAGRERLFVGLEWFFTIVFTVEYAMRIYCAQNRRSYIFSFYGVVDLLSILPSYLALVFTGASYLLIIRLLRVLRILRILKMIRYVRDANILLRSLWQSRRKVAVFFGAVLIMSVIFGSMMFLVEGPEHGFTSIPTSVYWTIVTITTVGYGDITPQTTLGQIVASMTMLTGYSIIAVPTGIFTAELASEVQRDRDLRSCNNCSRSGHNADAAYCRHCGAQLESLSG